MGTQNIILKDVISMVNWGTVKNLQNITVKK